ncbi:hypothetical protein ANN_12540 [Periplaneta americana]|uniref:Uncharacterized protein n=1 Tax=Periplaneta americana TaxID=6978 RepID=A0ABQ8TH10_PERAM|nr:hypothetical protein ANN_12540 [Periplaneta americana]
MAGLNFKLLEIGTRFRVMVEGKPRKNLNQATCPELGFEPGPTGFATRRAELVPPAWLNRLRRLPAGLKLRSGAGSIPAWADYLVVFFRGFPNRNMNASRAIDVAQSADSLKSCVRVWVGSPFGLIEWFLPRFFPAVGLKPNGLWRVLGLTSFHLFGLITWLVLSDVFPNHKANVG